MVRNFDEFCAALYECGFSLGGGDAKGIYAIVPYGWESEPREDNPVRWHTGEPDTDPWEWRMRVLEERDDVAYGKLFFGVSGYIAKEWYPLFYAVRRHGETFEEAYYGGTVSAMAARAYAIVEQRGSVPLHELKKQACTTREEGKLFDRALTELQMRMFITMCGRAQKKNSYGVGYGWNSTVFTTVENYWRERDYYIEERDPDEAYDLLYKQVMKLNPEAQKRKVDKFIRG